MKNWKTTAEGILSLLTTVGVVLIGSGSPLLGVHTTQTITLTVAVLTAVSRFIQNDAPTVVQQTTKMTAIAQFEIHKAEAKYIPPKEVS